VLAVIETQLSKFFKLTKTNNTFTACNLFWLIGILIFSILVFRVVMFGLVDKEIIKDDILILPLSIWFILLVFQFKAIRKIYVFICWLIVAFLLVTMNIWIIKHTDLANTVNNTDNVKYFRGLFIPLIVYYFTSFADKFH